MNVQAGDLAVIVRSKSGNEGKIVDVIRFLGEAPEFDGFVFSRGYGPCWLVSSKGSSLKHVAGPNRMDSAVPDAWLRPIRPDAEPESTETTRELERTA